MSAQSVYVLMPRNCGCVLLHSRRDFADVIMLSTLKWSDYPGLSRWAQCNRRILIRKEAGRRVRDRQGKNVTVEVLVELMHPRAKECEQPLEAGKVKELSLP